MNNLEVVRCSWDDIPAIVSTFVRSENVEIVEFTSCFAGEDSLDTDMVDANVPETSPSDASPRISNGSRMSGSSTLVLLCRTEAGQPFNKLCAYLDGHEIARGEAFLFTELQQNYLYAHAMLKRVLCSVLELPPQALNLRKGKFGKPYLDWPEKQLQFNLSRSNDVCAICINKQFRVGIDIEVHNHNIAMSELVQAYFAESEVQQWKQTRHSERGKFFFSLWTLKEAFVKCLGTGLSVPLNSFSISILNEGEAEVRDEQNKLLSTQLNYGRLGENISWAIARSSYFSECEYDRWSPLFGQTTSVS